MITASNNNGMQEIRTSSNLKSSMPQQRNTNPLSNLKGVLAKQAQGGAAEDSTEDDEEWTAMQK